MHACLKSACVVLAWSILVVLVAVGMKGSVPPAQANIRTASSSSTQVTLASTLSVAAAPKTVARPAPRYVVRPGDTLSGIAARFAVRGGWPALYAANRPLIGPDPDVIRPGTVLVLPGRMAPVRYTVAAGDTLAGIAARFAVRGGWPALYAANRRVIGPDPNVIRPGTVLTVRRPAAPAPPASRPGHPHPVPPTAVGGQRAPSRARRARALRPPAGMPRWLRTMLLAAGPAHRGRVPGRAGAAGLRAGARRASARAAAGRSRPESQCSCRRRATAEPDPGRPAAEEARIVLADYDRVVVTQSLHDGAVYVLRPPVRIPG